MAAVIDYLHEFHTVSIVARLILAMAAGGAVGLGRSRGHQSAGLRTYMLTSVGAALTILISMYEYEMICGPWAEAAALADLKFDGTRFSAQVVNGIGFLAAGTIIAVAHQQIKGLTTAVGLFASAIMGIAAGAGFFECVLIALVMIVFTLEVMEPLEVRFKRKMRNITLYIEMESIEDMAKLREVIEGRNAKLFDIDVERSEKKGEQYPAAILTIKMGKEHPSHSGMLSSLAELPCVYSIQELIA